MSDDRYELRRDEWRDRALDEIEERLGPVDRGMLYGCVLCGFGPVRDDSAEAAAHRADPDHLIRLAHQREVWEMVAGAEGSRERADFDEGFNRGDD